MKRLITLLALTCAAAASFGATLNPVQLLNPVGSASGQTIVSSGPTTAPAWGTIGYNALPVQIPNSLIGNVSNSTQAPGVVGLPSCASNTNALIYTNGAGFTCNTNINASTLGGQTFASPGSIGTGVSAPGAFTTLAAAGNDALLYTSSNALSVPNATVVTVTNWTKTFDRLNTNFNATTGVFTAPVTGYYLVCAQVVYAAAANVVSSQFVVGVQVAGSTVAGAGGSNYALATGTSQISANGCATVAAIQAQAITIVTTQNSGSTRTLSSANVSITRIP